MVALHAVDGRVDHFDVGAVLLEDTFTDPVDGGLSRVGVADYAALAYIFAAGYLNFGFLPRNPVSGVRSRPPATPLLPRYSGSLSALA